MAQSNTEPSNPTVTERIGAIFFLVVALLWDVLLCYIGYRLGERHEIGWMIDPVWKDKIILYSAPIDPGASLFFWELGISMIAITILMVMDNPALLGKPDNEVG
jgi:hypothetical protein